VEGEYEALTGVRDVREVGSLLSYQGKTDLTFWDSQQCNRIQ
jgi:hypothetical protein